MVVVVVVVATLLLLLEVLVVVVLLLFANVVAPPLPSVCGLLIHVFVSSFFLMNPLPPPASPYYSSLLPSLPPSEAPLKDQERARSAGSERGPHVVVFVQVCRVGQSARGSYFHCDTLQPIPSSEGKKEERLRCQDRKRGERNHTLLPFGPLLK